MTEQYFPTEQELDALLECAPVFDPEAVKRNVLTYAAGETVRPRRPKLPVRGLLIAAVACVLSVSVIAAADYVSGGRIIRALTVTKQPQQIVEAEPETVPDEETEEMSAVVQPLPKPVGQPVKPTVLPELDEQIAEALQVTPVQKETLRPAVQNVEQTAEAQDVRMTVLQTVGDPACVYVKVRFDFPVEVPISMEYGFEDIDMTFGLDGGSSGNHPVIERTENSVTYLLESHAVGLGPEGFSGKTATLSFKNYGREKVIGRSVVTLQTEVGKPERFIVDPQMNILANATEEDLAAISGALESTEQLEDGFTLGHMTDGTLVLDYDGAHGVRYVSFFTDGDYPEVMVGDNPRFDAVVEGEWSQSWVVDYQDTSLYWSGEERLLDPSLTIKSLRLSPFSWEAVFEGDELAPMKLPKQWEAQLLHTDGSLTDFTMKRNMTTSSMDGWRCTLKTVEIFDETIELSDVKAMVINGKEFPIS